MMKAEEALVIFFCNRKATSRLSVLSLYLVYTASLHFYLHLAC